MPGSRLRHQESRRTAITPQSAHASSRQKEPVDLPNNMELLLQQFGEVIQTPALPWPSAYPQLFVRKLREPIDATPLALAHLWPPAIQRSTLVRRYEYLLGRLAAASLLAQLGVPTPKCWVGQQDRRPLWPQGIAASISHTDTLLIVSAGPCTEEIEAIGVDIERASIDEETSSALHLCFTANEMQRLHAMESGLVIGFSAKEALFKCLSHESNGYFDFLDVEIIDVDVCANTLSVRLLTNLSARLQRGMILSIAHRLIDDHVWTGALWGPRSNKEEPNPQAFRLAQREAMPLHATGPRIPAHPYQSSLLN